MTAAVTDALGDDDDGDDDADNSDASSPSVAGAGAAGAAAADHDQRRLSSNTSRLSAGGDDNRNPFLIDTPSPSKPAAAAPASPSTTKVSSIRARFEPAHTQSSSSSSSSSSSAAAAAAAADAKSSHRSRTGGGFVIGSSSGGSGSSSSSSSGGGSGSGSITATGIQHVPAGDDEYYDDVGEMESLKGTLLLLLLLLLMLLLLPARSAHPFSHVTSVPSAIRNGIKGIIDNATIRYVELVLGSLLVPSGLRPFTFAIVIEPTSPVVTISH